MVYVSYVCDDTRKKARTRSGREAISALLAVSALTFALYLATPVACFGAV